MPEPYYTEKITFDLREAQNCLKAAEDIDYVYNLAANMGGIGFITSTGADIMRDNSLININMLEAAVKNKIKRFFFSSSACVYPEEKQLTPEVIPLKESDAYPAHPDTYYGWEKLYAEELCLAYTKDYGLEIRIARFHNIYGPFGTYDGGREKAPAAMCRKIAKAKNNAEIEIWGDGLQTRSYCYIDDCVAGVIALMNSNITEPLNIGSDRLVSVNKLADIVAKIAGKTISKKYKLNAPQGVRGRNADLSLVKEKLGWEPKVSLEEGLEETYEWIKSKV